MPRRSPDERDDRSLTAADFDPGLPERRAVLVAVGDFDRRAVHAARYANLIPADRRVAVHVAVDPEAAHRVGLEWMQTQSLDLPLQIVDDAGGVDATLASVARAVLADGADEVVLVIGELSMQGRSRWLLHDGTARKIVDALEHVSGAVAMLLQVPIHA